MAWNLNPRYNYRIAFVIAVLRFFVPPIALAYSLLRSPLIDQKRSGKVSRYGFEAFCRLVILILSVPLYWTVRIQYKQWAKKRAAASLGAVLIPEVPSKSIGGIDLMRFLVRSNGQSYHAAEIDQWFKELNSDTINLRFMWQDVVFTKNHNTVQIMLATGFDNWVKAATGTLRSYSMFGKGIFNTNGAEWKAHRLLTRPFFARERVTDFNNFNYFADKAIDIFRERAEAEEAVDVQDIFGRFTLDAAGQFLFGTSELNSLDAPSPRAGKAKLGPKGSAVEGNYGGFVTAFEELQVEFPKRFAKAILEKEKRGGAKMGPEEGCLTDHICDSTSDRKLIRDELINILLASRDTTAALLSFTTYALALHPEVSRKLRQEIRAVVPRGPPTYEDIKKLKYLRAVLNETLRLFPPVPVDERAAVRPCLVPSSREDGKPYYMPAPDVQVRYSLLLMHRREDLWGKDALEYNPERWIDPERVKSLAADPFRFLPFNAGPRICLGQNFAYNEASFMMVRIMQEFDSFELRQHQDAPEGSLPTPEMGWTKLGGRYASEKVWPRGALTLYSKGGIWVRMQTATSN